MRTVIVRDAMRIPLGKQGENNAVLVVWPMIAEKYAKLYGKGRFELVVVQRGKAYPAMVSLTGTDLVWAVRAADVATAEVGSLELIYYVGDTIAKSQTWETIVVASKSADGMTEPPEPQKSWVDEVLKAGASAEKASAESVNASNQSVESANVAVNAANSAAQSASDAKTAANIAVIAANSAKTSEGAANESRIAAESAKDASAQSAKDAKAANEAAQGAQTKAEAAAQESVKKAQEAAQSAAEAKESAGKAANMIDDTALARDKTWSSRNIVDMVCPAIEETGNPVVCTPVPNYPLGVKASWTPTQEGSGEPSPDNIRPIKGMDSVTVERKEDSLTHTLTLPSTIYGGEVDAVTGEGRERVKITVVDGTEVKFIDVNGYWNLPNYSSRGISAILLSSHFNKNVFAFNARYGFVFTTKKIMESMFQTVDELNAYCADQYAAGTPVQIAYQVAEPTPFAATGGPPIPVLNGTNTILTDADSVTVTGRETPQSYIDRKLKETNTAIAAL